MGHSKKDKASGSNRARYALVSIPLIALAGVLFVYALTVTPAASSPAAMDYTFKLLIDVTNKQSNQVRAIAPGGAIGEAGGSWMSTQYNNDSVDSSHYPVYMDSPSYACTPVCLIHVKSKIVHTYTLGDFFNVWGQPLSENNTIGITASSGFVWSMCLGPDPASASFSHLWGAQPLQSDLDITLYFYDPSGGLGCAPS